MTSLPVSADFGDALVWWFLRVSFAEKTVFVRFVMLETDCFRVQSQHVCEKKTGNTDRENAGEFCARKKRERETKGTIFFNSYIFIINQKKLCGVQRANSVTFHIAGWLPGTCGC
jgi:hypothetical protein